MDGAAVSPVLMNRKRFMSAGVFRRVPRIDDSRLAEIFAREVPADLVRKELLGPEWAERILSWRHTGFNVHSRVRAKTNPEVERVGKYMIRPVLAPGALDFSGARGQGRLSLEPGHGRSGDDGLSGVHCPGDLAHSRQGPNGGD